MRTKNVAATSAASVKVVLLAASVLTSASPEPDGTGSPSILANAGGCWPRCCAPGEILDRTRTKCLVNHSLPPPPTDCPRSSFLPTCRGSGQDGLGLVSPEVRPLDKKQLTASKVLKGLSQYVLKEGGGGGGGTADGVVNFFNVKTPNNTNLGDLDSAAASGSGETEAAIDRHGGYEIPSSFCVDLDNEQTLVCPQLELDNRATIFKCCPFGQQLKSPLYTGCKPLEDNQWTLPLQGRRVKLEDLIRLPKNFVRFDASFHRRLNSNLPCETQEKRLLFDYESFQVDRQGRLAFTRILGKQRIEDKFCVDLVSAPKEETSSFEAAKPKANFMVAIFCQPDNVTKFDQDLLKLRLANVAATQSPTIFIITVMSIVEYLLFNE